MSINRGDIFYVNPSETVGSEQRSGRPAIIVSNPLCNEHSPVVEVVYLTCQYKKPMPTHVRIESAGKRSTALCEQKKRSTWCSSSFCCSEGALSVLLDKAPVMMRTVPKGRTL